MSTTSDPFPWDEALEAAPTAAPELSNEERATVDRIEQTPAEDLADVDAADRFGPGGTGETVSSIEDVPAVADELARDEASSATSETAPVPWVGIEGITAALDNLADLTVRQATIRPAIDTVVTAVRQRAADRAVRRPAKVKDPADLRREIVGVTRDGDVLAEMARVFTTGAEETKGILGDLLDELPTRGDRPRMSAKVEDGDGFDLKITRSRRTEVKVDDEALDDVLATWLVAAAEDRHKRLKAEGNESESPIAIATHPAKAYAAGVRAALGSLRNVLSASPGYRTTALDSLVRVMGGADEDELASRLAKAYGRVERGEPSIKLDRTPVKRVEDEEPAGE